MSQRADEDDDDDEYIDEPTQRHTSNKRKRAAGASSVGSSSVSSSSPSSVSSRRSGVVSFPLLSDDEPSLTSLQSYVNTSSCPSSSSSSSSVEIVSQQYHCVSKHLFSLTDENRDRGSAKIAVITVDLRHASGNASFTSSFKIDGRKSFSNAPFKRYYHRGVHAAWFAEPASLSPVASALSEGRVLMLISQRAGRPNGKGFTGLKHDPSTYTPKHPLLCLSSNSVEYYVQVFVNLDPTPMVGDESMQLDDWTEVDVDVSARFDVGQVSFEPVSRPEQAPNAKRQCIAQPARRIVVEPIVLPDPMPAVASVPRPTSTTSTLSDHSGDDSSDEWAESPSTPIQTQHDAGAETDGEYGTDSDELTQYRSHDDSNMLQLADLSGIITLPDEFVTDDESAGESHPQQQWSWSDAVHQAPMPKVHPVFQTAQATMMHFPASPVFASSCLDDSLPSAADLMLVQGDRAARCAKLSIDHSLMVEPLFLAHHEWTLASPTTTHLSPIQSPLAGLTYM